ncbi:TPA: nucleotidyltransferase domain-containing protein [Candidatus Dependentiae bacterium]|nr:MAG: hypothetical protein US03_C0004G0090 [candidate division TM6 bacterium GW2011_GWF2_36_131]KKQ03268.1 MAG: hypothetical protein US13_C0004G0090 [candidate division TM6 bacterium GW2011_GWE2_36_25]KKQ19190.1 MAG: hypothetical protein US32_C0014G0011 [candidate division TM6 bacterium GW2011_GWA2_36_9]HBR70304.1 nucleotidyltransferase domain-containing protein [Candidatus Dependentiae bacterium]HCU00849.1 nucleotidyltransferase domain-containing protein [Candidatus Dependentiae bacterium]
MVEPEYKKKLIEIINKYLPKAKIYLYGSRARGDHSEGSDIDLAIDTGKPVNFSIIGNIKEAIEESTIPLFVDVIDIQNASSNFINEIKKEWIPW